MTRYNVTWRHYKYEACDTKVTNNRSYESSFVPSPNKKIVIQDKLLSYSLYELWVGAETLDEYYEVKDAFKVFSTAQSPPDIRTGSSEFLETERYGQALTFHWRKPDCRDLNGPHQDYVVELEGLDPWDKGAKELLDNTPVFESFYVQGLKPFTSYLLRVFTRNKGGFQSLVSLDIKARTLETVALPPTNIHLKAISPTSVHMQWSPAWPPTGKVKMFKISFRQQDKYWSQPTEVDLTHRGACVKTREQRAVPGYSSQQGEEFCYVFNNLSEDTKYGFRIKTYNKGVEDDPEWSEVVNVTTPPLEKEEEPAVVTEAPDIVTAPPVTDIVIGSSVSPDRNPDPVSPTTPVTIIDISSHEPERERPKPVPVPDTALSQSETTTRNLVIIVIGLLCGIIFLGVLITAVVYKMKIVRLKRQMRSEELWNQGRDPDNISHSVSYIGSVNTRLSDVSAYATISDVSFSLNDNSFSNRADPRIQSRRLPEVPPAVRNRAENLSEPQYSDAYELEPLPGGGYLDMSRSPSRSSRRHSRVADASVLQVCK